MKTRLLTLALILIAGSITSDLSAQERIKALFKKCETLTTVDIDMLRNFPGGKVPGKDGEETINIKFKDNEALLNEFIAAFKAEEHNSKEVMEKREAGKLTRIYMEFEDANYTLRIEKRDVRISQERRIKAEQ